MTLSRSRIRVTWSPKSRISLRTILWDKRLFTKQDLTFYKTYWVNLCFALSTKSVLTVNSCSAFRLNLSLSIYFSPIPVSKLSRITGLRYSYNMSRFIWLIASLSGNPLKYVSKDVLPRGQSVQNVHIWEKYTLSVLRVTYSDPCIKQTHSESSLVSASWYRVSTQNGL